MRRRRKRRSLKPRLPARIRRRKRRRRAEWDGEEEVGSQHPELIGLGLLALGLFLASLLYLGWSGGVVGEASARGLRTLLGSAAYLLPVACVSLGALMVARSDLPDVRPFRTGLVVLFTGLLLALGGAHGGYAGRALDKTLGRLLGGTGIAILGSLALLVGVLLLTGASVGALLRRSGRTLRVLRSGAEEDEEEEEEGWPEPAETLAGPSALAAGPAPLIDGVHDYPELVAADEPTQRGRLALVDEAEEDEEEYGDEEYEDEEEEDEEEEEEDGGEPDEDSLFDVEPGDEDYELPDPDVLRLSPTSKAKGEPAGRVAEVLVRTLADFGIEATVIGRISGPRVSRYELKLAPGTKVSKVASLKDDLAYALATTEIRILAPIPGKQAVGVELPNVAPNYVTLGDIYEDLPATSSPLAVWLGKDLSGNAVWTDLARMPHVLIAGTTGSGKSGCINTMLTSILLRSTPDDVRMILVDPKRIELEHYESIPHLLAPVVSSPKEATTVLANVVAEMDRRYGQLSLLRARNLPEANRALRSRDEAELPYLLVVIDELADLMMISPQAVEDAVIRLAQKSRAVGIHLVLATQRPSVDVITGMIKANVPSRIAFAVSSQTDSRVILDQAGAESLLGQGDMLFKPLGTSQLQRLQGAYVSEEEIALIVEQCRHQREQELDESLLEAPEEPLDDEEADDEDELDPDEDPLLERAIELVIQTQTASVSLLQRRLRVGYTRAGRLVDMLERRGIISGYEGSKPRRVLVDEADLERVLPN